MKPRKISLCSEPIMINGHMIILISFVKWLRSFYFIFIIYFRHYRSSYARKDMYICMNFFLYGVVCIILFVRRRRKNSYMEIARVVRMVIRRDFDAHLFMFRHIMPIRCMKLHTYLEHDVWIAPSDIFCIKFHGHIVKHLYSNISK